MANGNGNTLNYIYKAGMAILFVIMCFLANRVYTEVSSFPTTFVPNARFEAIENKVHEMPTNYVSLERYKCDIERVERTLNRIDRKMDRAFPNAKMAEE